MQRKERRVSNNLTTLLSRRTAFSSAVRGISRGAKILLTEHAATYFLNGVPNLPI